MKSNKKLIEVSLPLEAINKASAQAVIFVQMVKDPSSYADLLRGDAQETVKVLAVGTEDTRVDLVQRSGAAHPPFSGSNASIYLPLAHGRTGYPATTYQPTSVAPHATHSHHLRRRAGFDSCP